MAWAVWHRTHMRMRRGEMRLAAATVAKLQPILLRANHHGMGGSVQQGKACFFRCITWEYCYV